MTGFLLGIKFGQSQVFDEKGQRIPVTFIKVIDCYLTGIKEEEKHGYVSLQLGCATTKNIKKSVQGTLTKAGIKTPLRFLRELRIKKNTQYLKVIEEEGRKGIEIDTKKVFIGDRIQPNMFFKQADLVNVVGVSKGKGFQGVVKRHGFRGGPKTHGQSDRERAPGSIGQTTTPGRVYKGKRMAGRMGGGRITIKNLPVIEAKEEEIVVKGLVPGPKLGLLKIIGVVKE